STYTYPLFINQLSMFFFFQAEDGIRDRNVTGVQTCALPICHRPPGADRGAARIRRRLLLRLPLRLGGTVRPLRGGEYDRVEPPRSEERRVGKECQDRGAQKPQKRKNRKDIDKKKEVSKLPKT